MTSPDPLSWQEYTIDPDWRFRSTVLTPMFVETQASQSTLQARTQEGSISARRAMAGQVRATQQQLDFTPTQSAGTASAVGMHAKGTMKALMAGGRMGWVPGL